MGTKKSKPPTRSRRKVPSPAGPVPDLEALHEHIEQERERLMDAEAVLDCVIHAMDEDVRMSASGPSYANVIRIVRGLVNATIDKLDSVNVKAVMAASNSRDDVLHREVPPIAAGASGVQKEVTVKYRGVKETPPAYLH